MAIIVPSFVGQFPRRTIFIFITSYVLLYLSLSAVGVPRRIRTASIALGVRWSVLLAYQNAIKVFESNTVDGFTWRSRFRKRSVSNHFRKPFRRETQQPQNGAKSLVPENALGRLSSVSAEDYDSSIQG